MSERVIGNKPLSAITADAYLAALAALDAAEDAEGDTKAELAARWGCSPATATKRIARLVAAGKVLMVGYRCRGQSQSKVYRVVEEAKRKGSAVGKAKPR